jgi:hypothetical protein
MTADTHGLASSPGAKREDSSMHLANQQSLAMPRRPRTPNRTSDHTVACAPGSHPTRVILIERGGVVVEALSPMQTSGQKKNSGPASPSTPVGALASCAKHGFLVPSPNEQARLLANAARAARLARLDQVQPAALVAAASSRAVAAHAFISPWSARVREAGHARLPPSIISCASGISAA